ncbi:MAG TPA: YqaJ viral recombinase family protein [Candidatus Nitrosotalea sp.]|nr:YqaJ viral recombinase family protein [Candidatus Nitrosotalea sp.]
MNSIDLEQGSELWLAVRRGLITASRVSDLVATNKNGSESAARKNYRAELIVEILTGQTPDKFVTREMQWGIDQEPFARAAYELERDVMVETCGFVLHPSVARFGCSPDGLVGEDGMVQIKCPATATHLAWLQAGAVPLEHAAQMVAELACTGRKWNDFVSFDPRLPAGLQLFICRMERDEQLIALCEMKVAEFNLEIRDVISDLPGGPQLVLESLDQVNRDEMVF